MEKDFKVTPWEVTGDIDYDELIVRFGTKRIDESMLARLSKYGELHPLLKRGMVYSHRDLEWLLNRYDRATSSSCTPAAGRPAIPIWGI